MSGKHYFFTTKYATIELLIQGGTRMKHYDITKQLHDYMESIRRNETSESFPNAAESEEVTQVFLSIREAIFGEALINLDVDDFTNFIGNDETPIYCMSMLQESMVKEQLQVYVQSHEELKNSTDIVIIHDTDENSSMFDVNDLIENIMQSFSEEVMCVYSINYHTAGFPNRVSIVSKSRI